MRLRVGGAICARIGRGTGIAGQAEREELLAQAMGGSTCFSGHPETCLRVLSSGGYGCGAQHLETSTEAAG